MLAYYYKPTILPGARVCNNAAELCSRPYDTIVHLGAHDSPYIRDANSSYSSFGNQFFNTTVQLDAGVRLLSAQIHLWHNSRTGARELRLCHTGCAFMDAGLLRDWLWEIRTWLDRNPFDVVTIVLVNNDGFKATEIRDEFGRADIAHYGWVPTNLTVAPPPSNETYKTWPSLNEMIDSGARLVAFVAPLGPDLENAPYLLDEFTFLWENKYKTTAPGNFSCLPDRPTGLTMSTALSSGRLFLMNHMLYWQQAFGIMVPDIRYVNETNSWDGAGGLGKHAMECGNALRRLPTFVLVDFFNVGPAISAVDILNHVTRPVGRANVTRLVVGGGAGVELTISSAGAIKPRRLKDYLVGITIVVFFLGGFVLT